MNGYVMPPVEAGSDTELLLAIKDLGPGAGAGLLLCSSCRWVVAATTPRTGPFDERQTRRRRRQSNDPWLLRVMVSAKCNPGNCRQRLVCQAQGLNSVNLDELFFSKCVLCQKLSTSKAAGFSKLPPGGFTMFIRCKQKRCCRERCITKLQVFFLSASVDSHCPSGASSSGKTRVKTSMPY
jgi:hypothetical protein